MENDLPNQKSLRLAKYLSYLYPGLGSIYAGKYTKGFLWMCITFPLFVLFLFAIKTLVYLHAIGGDKYFTRRFNPNSTAFVIIAGYLWCCRYSSKDAVTDANDHNNVLIEMDKELNCKK